MPTAPSWVPARFAPSAGARRPLLAVAIALLATVAAAHAAAVAAAAVPAHGRHWELVTEGTVGYPPITNVEAVDASGDDLIFNTAGQAPGAPAGQINAYNTARRGERGWSLAPLGFPYSSPRQTFGALMLVGAGPGMAMDAWTSSTPLLPEAPPMPTVGLYTRGADGVLKLRTSAADMTVWEVSDDMRRIVFSSKSHLLPADAGRADAHGGVYVLDGDTLRLASDDGGALASCDVQVGVGSQVAPGAVSADVERVFMSGTDSCGSPRVYLYDGGATTEISRSRCARPDCNAEAPVRFAGATPSGGTAFVSTTQQLTDDDVDEGRDVYRYDVATDQLTRISAGAPGVVADVVESTAVVASSDGSRAYFLARGQLVPGEGSADQPNVYLADAGGIRFVATIGIDDPWVRGVAYSGLYDVVASPDGEMLMFTTAAALSSDDLDVKADIYVYRYGDDSLTRASGTATTGNGPFDVFVTPFRFMTTPLRRIPQPFSANGRIFFVTDEALVPEDVNGVRDVYEWFDGDVGMITSGRGDKRMTFSGATADGRSVFFVTDVSLVKSDDDDGEPDLYVARLGADLPGPPDPPVVGCAERGDCPLPPVQRLTRSTPASAAFGDRRAGRLEARPPARRALRRLAATGRARLVVHVPVGGVVTVRGRARIDGRARIVLRGRRAAKRAGALGLPLRLSALARDRIASGESLTVKLTVRHSRLAAGNVLRFRLGGAR